MAPRVVLVTGVADQLGGQLANQLAADPTIDRVLGVDTMVHAAPRPSVGSRRAATHDLPGVFNAGGDGVLMLSQAIRRAGRVPLPMPRAAIGPAARLAGARVELSPGQARLLNDGRVIDTTRLKNTFGFTPRWTTSAAFDDYVRGR